MRTRNLRDARAREAGQRGSVQPNVRRARPKQQAKQRRAEQRQDARRARALPRGEKADDPARRRVDAINENLAHRFDGDPNVVRANLADCFLTADGTLPAETAPDFLHPKAVGYERWAEKIEPELEKTLGPIPAGRRAAPAARLVTGAAPAPPPTG